MPSKPKPNLFLVFVSPRAADLKSFDYVEIAAVKGGSAQRDFQAAVKSRTDDCDLTIFADEDVLKSALNPTTRGKNGALKKKAKKRTFLQVGWHVWECKPVDSNEDPLFHRKGMPMKNYSDGKWRRPKADDGWAKKLALPL